MKTRLTASAYSYIAVIVIALAVIVSGLTMQYIQSKLLPLVLGGGIMILATAGLWKDIRREGMAKTTPTGVEKDDDTKSNWRGYLNSVVWTAGFILAIYLLGFLISMPVFIFSYMKTHNISWLTSIISAIVASATIILSFQTLLGVELYPGLLFTWLER